MKKLIITSIGLLMSVSATADTIQCHFTEPFVHTTYDMSQLTLTYDMYGVPKNLIKSVAFQIKSAGEFQLVSKEGEVLQTLKLNNAGSDGMSDDIFPFEVKDNNKIMTANMGIGGCSSEKLSVKKIN